jgi:hypothetical protein
VYVFAVSLLRIEVVFHGQTGKCKKFAERLENLI